jgi:hypothetical protein
MTVLRAPEELRELTAPLAMRPDHPPGDSTSVRIARYWSEMAKEKEDPPGVFYYWKGERPRHPDAPQLEGTGEIQVEAADRAAGYFTPRLDTHPSVKVRTSGLYVRADPGDISILDGRDDRKRAELITERLRHWQSM